MDKMTDAEIEAARAIIANQASTRPEPNAGGLIDIGMKGAWERAAGVHTVSGRKAHQMSDHPIFGAK